MPWLHPMGALLLAGAAQADLLDETTSWSLPDSGATWDAEQGRSDGGSLHLERAPDSPGARVEASRRLPLGVRGRHLELEGWVRAEALEGRGGIWLKTYAPGGQLFSQRVIEPLEAGEGWQKLRLRVPLDPRVESVVVGASLVGTGSLWVDELALRVDRRPLERARPRAPSAYWDDHRFDEGSGVQLQSLTPVQLDNLVLLGEVWGFLKYHHPVVTGGDRQWDYSLFEVLPAVLAASDAETGRALITDFAQSLGDPPPCRPCARLPDELQQPPELEWIRDEARLGAPLAHTLQRVYDRRPALLEQTYVQSVRGLGGASFVRERSYPDIDPSDAGYRILAAFRIWNVVQYWSPYRELPDHPWSTVLRRSLPAVVEARSADEYELALVRLLAHVDDSHTNLWGSLDAVPPRGDAMLPLRLRSVDGQLVVWDAVAGTPIEVGDVLLALDGVGVDDQMERMRPYYPASNPDGLLRNITRLVSIGPPGPVEVELLREGAAHTVRASRVDGRKVELDWTHDRSGETLQVLGGRTAYVKLSSVEREDVESIVAAAVEQGSLVIDLRNYPSASMLALARHLVADPTSHVRFTRCDIDNPGAFVWNEPSELQPRDPHVDVPVAILVDELSQSSSEFHAMAFQSSPRARVFGSTTAGADGNVTHVPIPGGHRSSLTSIGVFYPDGTPTQRVGVVIDEEVRPSVQGIRQGRDEVLEAALRWIWGDATSEEAVIEAARRRPAP